MQEANKIKNVTWHCKDYRDMPMDMKFDRITVTNHTHPISRKKLFFSHHHTLCSVSRWQSTSAFVVSAHFCVKSTKHWTTTAFSTYKSPVCANNGNTKYTSCIDVCVDTRVDCVVCRMSIGVCLWTVISFAVPTPRCR